MQATRRVVVQYGEVEFALQLALHKGKRAASVRHDCKASTNEAGVGVGGLRMSVFNGRNARSFSLLLLVLFARQGAPIATYRQAD